MNPLLRLFTQPQDVREFWIDILGQYAKGRSEVYYQPLKARHNISRPTFYRWLKRGIDTLGLTENGIILTLREDKIVFENKATEIPQPTQKQVVVEKIEPEIVHEAILEPQIEKPKVVFDYNETIGEIIGYLNLKANKKYNPKSKHVSKHVLTRLKEGYNVDDFKKVIDVKCSKWKNTTMNDYLRPETLFSGKFETYLNESPQINGIQERFIKTQQAVDEAKSFDFFGNSES
jgi:uncharacterized phage protein (TIGR02220 family)